MRFRVLCLVGLSVSLGLGVLADEGQWPPEQLAKFDATYWQGLKARGLTLSANDLWDGQGGGLMTAVVNLGGCTASFISPEGLIATNHHCAFGAIQLASTAEKNYLQDGFVARSRSEEVGARGGGSRVYVIKKISDVTARVRGANSPFARAKSDYERWDAVERAKREIVAECEKTPNSRCDVAAFYEGREYRLMEQMEIKDIRLVYAPPVGVGNYGGEVDNFNWPRHTGDFTILRAYVAPDGSPAAFDAKNVPYRPARWLKVSDQGVGPGDLVMIMGYPGRTQRFLDAESVRNQQEWNYPLRAKTNAELIAILEEFGKKDAETALKVASAIKGHGNSMTNARGQVAGLTRNGVVARVRAEEERLAEYLAKNTNLPASWRTALDEVRRITAADRVGQERRYFLEEIERTSGYLGSYLNALRWAAEREKPESERESGYQPRDFERAKQREKDLAKTLVPAAQRRVLAYHITHALKAAGEWKIPSLEETFGFAPTAEGVEAKLLEMDQRTNLSDEAVRLALLQAPLVELKTERLARMQASRANDHTPEESYSTLAIKLSVDLAELRRKRREVAGALLRVRPDLLSAIAAMRAADGKLIYPDANGTLRVSFATVKGYVPREALFASPQTSVLGLLEMETGVEPFASPEKILTPVRARDFGRFVDPRMKAVPICFLSDGDTTGGNSGSPTLNGRGELVGLNFDRVWENVAGDFGWNVDRSRNVNADIRYALWMMDRVDHVQWLLDELLGSSAPGATGK